MFETDKDLIASFVLMITIETEYEDYDPKEMLKSWRTMTSTAREIEI